jgi:hypothetical protein
MVWFMVSWFVVPIFAGSVIAIEKVGRLVRTSPDDSYRDCLQTFVPAARSLRFTDTEESFAMSQQFCTYPPDLSHDQALDEWRSIWESRDDRP